MQAGGVATLGVGVWFLMDSTIYQRLQMAALNEQGSLGLPLVYVLLTVAALAIITGFVGLLAAGSEHTTLIIAVRSNFNMLHMFMLELC